MDEPQRIRIIPPRIDWGSVITILRRPNGVARFIEQELGCGIEAAHFIGEQQPAAAFGVREAVAFLAGAVFPVGFATRDVLAPGPNRGVAGHLGEIFGRVPIIGAERLQDIRVREKGGPLLRIHRPQLRQVLEKDPKGGAVAAHQCHVACDGLHAPQVRELVQEKHDSMVGVPGRPHDRDQMRGNHQPQPAMIRVEALGRQNEKAARGRRFHAGELDGRAMEHARHAGTVEEMRMGLRRADHTRALLVGFLEHASGRPGDETMNGRTFAHPSEKFFPDRRRQGQQRPDVGERPPFGWLMGHDVEDQSREQRPGFFIPEGLLARFFAIDDNEHVSEHPRIIEHVESCRVKHVQGIIGRGPTDDIKGVKRVDGGAEFSAAACGHRVVLSFGICDDDGAWIGQEIGNDDAHAFSRSRWRDRDEMTVTSVAQRPSPELPQE